MVLIGSLSMSWLGASLRRTISGAAASRPKDVLPQRSRLSLAPLVVAAATAVFIIIFVTTATRQPNQSAELQNKNAPAFVRGVASVRRELLAMPAHSPEQQATGGPLG